MNESPYAWTVGKRVIVIWTDKAYVAGKDWISFVVLDACDDGLWMQGVTSPDGSKHDGTKTFARQADIREVIEWTEAVDDKSDDGWIPWSGGECPVDPDAKLFLRFRNGMEGLASLPAGRYVWNHGLHPFGADIVAYKPA